MDLKFNTVYFTQKSIPLPHAIFKVWAAARKLIKDDDDLPCECSF